MSSFFTKDLAIKVLGATEPANIALRNKGNLELLFNQSGINVELSDADFIKIQQALDASNDFSNVNELFDAGGSGDDLNAEALIAILSALKNIVTTFKVVTQGSPDPSLTPPLNQNELWQRLGRETIDRLTFEAIEADIPIIGVILLVTGIAEINDIDEPGPDKIPYRQYIIHWEKLGDFLNDPLSLIKDTYGWEDNTDGFNYKRFYQNLRRALKQVRFYPRIEAPEALFLDKYYSAGNPIRDDINILKVPFHIEFSQDFSSFSEVGIQFMPIPEEGDANGKPAGFSLAPLFKGAFSNSGSQDNDSGVSLNISAGLETDALFRLLIRPSGVSLESDSGNTNLNAEIALVGKPESPYILIGTAESHRLELEGFLTSIGFKGNINDPEFIFKAGTGQGASSPKFRFIFQAGDSDGFLKTILGEDPHSIDLSGMIHWSSKHGIGFEGTAGFSILLPLHLPLGPISIDAVAIDASAGSGDPKIGLGINLSGELGPLSFVCEQIGAQLTLTPVDGSSESGILGNLNADWGFKPPNGLGLAINAGAVTGGGYLFFDHENGEYAGALELTIAEFISAKAIGLITTKMPDGSKGFSMLVIITAEFNPPFQLGFGFTLNGVGGLLGLNRTVLLDPLRDGVRTGAVNNIMFPDNVIANATRIISDLKTIFPPNDDKFLIGPMGKVGWGTPSLITLSVGLIIEIPGNAAILGVMKIALPEERLPLVQIQVAFVGTLDFNKKMLTFDASLYESFILHMPLEGDMAVRLKWGDQPDFILTVGGFHPTFNPPPLALPTLRRLSISILNTSIAKIRVECYQAVTSNTVQFGAKAEIYFDLKACSIDGHIAFDALFQFSPFYFIIQLSSSFNLKAAGISVMSVRVKMSLEGTTPWKAKGTGSVSLLVGTISADFNKTWGDKKDTSLPKIEILPKFLKELDELENWSTDLSADKNLLVSLRKLEEDLSSELVLHPTGSLMVQQKLMPLTVNIDKVGNQKTSDIKKAVISGAYTKDLFDNQTALETTETKENFARAQFQELSDSKKLSKPSFEKMPGGIRISMGNNTIKNGTMVRKKVEYDVTIVDKEPVKPFKFGKFFTEIEALFTNFLKGGSVAKSELSLSHHKKFQPFEEKLDVLEEGYTVAFQSDNKAVDESATFSSEMMAQSYMQDQISENPALKKQVHIVPNYELQV